MELRVGALGGIIAAREQLQCCFTDVWNWSFVLVDTLCRFKYILIHVIQTNITYK